MWQFRDPNLDLFSSLPVLPFSIVPSSDFRRRCLTFANRRGIFQLQVQSVNVNNSVLGGGRWTSRRRHLLWSAYKFLIFKSITLNVRYRSLEDDKFHLHLQLLLWVLLDDDEANIPKPRIPAMHSIKLKSQFPAEPRDRQMDRKSIANRIVNFE